jgi:DNA-binding transcriptional ArsR family regulator
MSASKRDPGYESQQRIHQALGHRLRIELLSDLLEEESISASRFAKKHDLDKEGVSRASYHLKVLAKNDLVVLKERIPRRGAVENVYQLNDASSALSMVIASPDVNSRLGSQVLPDSRIKVVRLGVDERGVEEVKEVVREFQAHLDKVGAASRERLDSSAESPRSLQVVYTDVGSQFAG